MSNSPWENWTSGKWHTQMAGMLIFCYLLDLILATDYPCRSMITILMPNPVQCIRYRTISCIICTILTIITSPNVGVHIIKSCCQFPGSNGQYHSEVSLQRRRTAYANDRPSFNYCSGPLDLLGNSQKSQLLSAPLPQRRPVDGMTKSINKSQQPPSQARHCCKQVLTTLSGVIKNRLTLAQKECNNLQGHLFQCRHMS